MKNLSNKILIIAIALIINPALSKAQQTDTTITVNGVCGMCERVIEKAANLEGVELADWDVDAKTLKLSYDSSMVSLDEINKSINESGYDTEFSAAKEEDYQALHKCCHYRDSKVIDDHK